MISQFRFNNLKSYDDFGLTLIDVVVSYPSVNVVSVSVPFMSGSYDFSSLYGGQTYSNRTVKLKLAIEDMPDNTRTRLNILYDQVVKWLYTSQISDLKIDYVEHTFTGRVIEISEREEFVNTESIEVTFDCHPFRKSDLEEGHDIWDEFNFETDVAQDVSFDVIGSKEITIINAGSTAITPIISTNASFDVTLGGIVYKFPLGISKDYRFRLETGENKILLTGTGNIVFKFRKEVI